MFSLRCDYRENRGGCVISILRNLRAEGAIISADKYELRDEVMTTGDYAIQCSGYIILVERKTWEDLAASIKDKRIFENHKKMLAARDHGYRIMYLIEGRAPNPENSATKVSGIPMANMIAKLDHFAMRDGVWVEFTRSATHTAQRLLELGKNLLTLDSKSSGETAHGGIIDCITTGKIHDPRETSGRSTGETSGGSTGETSTESAREEKKDQPMMIRTIANPDEIIKKKYEKTTMQVREAMLGCIPGIGEKTARAILTSCSFPNIVTFSSAIGSLSLNTFQTSELLALSRGERPAVIIAMLTEIKGVSKNVACLIAANFTLAKLCARDTLTTAAIADLKTNAAGRRIGGKLAERISETWSDDVPSVGSTPQLQTTAQITAQINVVPQIIPPQSQITPADVQPVVSAPS